MNEFNVLTPTYEELAAQSVMAGDPTSSVHYISQGMQPIQLMQATMTKEEFCGFLKGNIIKYTFRAGKKGGESAEKDAHKAAVYNRWLRKANNGLTINPMVD